MEIYIVHEYFVYFSESVLFRLVACKFAVNPVELCKCVVDYSTNAGLLNELDLC